VFKITLAQAIYHNHRLDSAYDGRYLVRLPDFTLVYAEDYARRLAEYNARATPIRPNLEQRGQTV
jgi:hypothetical protein